MRRLIIPGSVGPRRNCSAYGCPASKNARISWSGAGDRGRLEVVSKSRRQALRSCAVGLFLVSKPHARRSGKAGTPFLRPLLALSSVGRESSSVLRTGIEPRCALQGPAVPNYDHPSRQVGWGPRFAGLALRSSRPAVATQGGLAPTCGATRALPPLAPSRESLPHSLKWRDHAHAAACRSGPLPAPAADGVVSGRDRDPHLRQLGGGARAAVVFPLHRPAVEPDAELPALRAAVPQPAATAAGVSAGERLGAGADADVHHQQPAVDRRAPAGGAGGFAG